MYNNEIFSHFFVFSHYHICKISARIMECIIFELCNFLQLMNSAEMQLYPELPHRPVIPGGMQTHLWGDSCTVQFVLREYCPVRSGGNGESVGSATPEAISVAFRGHLQLGVAHCATSLAFLK